MTYDAVDAERQGFRATVAGKTVEKSSRVFKCQRNQLLPGGPFTSVELIFHGKNISYENQSQSTRNSRSDIDYSLIREFNSKSR